MREDLSDVTDEDTGPAPAPPPPKPPAPAFRVKDDLDLFGLGLEEPGRKASSGEGSRAGASPWGAQPGHVSDTLHACPSSPGGGCPQSSRAVGSEKPQPCWGPAWF